MKVLVCGGRDFGNREVVWLALDRLRRSLGITEIIHGDASGADKLGGAWAEERGIPQRKFPADWQKHGKAAGPIRNQQMLDEGKPEAVVAFPGGCGTADMIGRAQKAGLLVIDLSWMVP